MLTYYTVLGISSDADEKAIRKAYKEAFTIWHPDKTAYWAPPDEIANCTEIFKYITNAYETLMDLKLRYAYNTKLSFPFPLPLEEEKKEKSLQKSWVELKKTYLSYKERQSNPQAIISSLQEQNEELKKRLHDRESENRALQESNAYTSQQLSWEQRKNRGLTEENSALLKQIQELQEQNHKLQSSKVPAHSSHETSAPKQNASKANNPALGIFGNSEHRNTFASSSGSNTYDKPESKGLQTIYKMVDTREYCGIKLAFKTPELAKEFQKEYKQFFEKNPDQFFFLESGSYRTFPFQGFKDEHVLKVTITNIYNKIYEHQSFEFIGWKILQELKKFVDITDIPQEFRGVMNNRILSDNELPEGSEALKVKAHHQ